MVIPTGSEIMVLVPLQLCSNHSTWTLTRKNNYLACCGSVVLSKLEYYIYTSYILTNPQLQKSMNGLSYHDFTEGLG